MRQEGTRRETEMETPKGKRPKVRKNSKVVANGTDKCVCMHTDKTGDDEHQRGANATVAMKLEETKELSCVLKDGQGFSCTVRSTLIKRVATNKETIESAILSTCGETHPYKTEQRAFAGSYSLWIRK